VHDLLVAHVAVREHDRVDLELSDEGLELLLGPDRDALGVARAGEGRRVATIRDAGDLRRGERDHLDARCIPVDDVEVVEVPAGGPHDQHAFGAHDHPFREGRHRHPRRSARDQRAVTADHRLSVSP
jgi:hypothetical protein